MPETAMNGGGADDLTRDRCRGCLVGLAAGNMLGVPVEGWPQAAIRGRYPDGVRDIEVRPEQPDDDDLAQAIILAAASLEADALDAEDLGRRFWEWAEENGLGIGILTAEVLTRYGGAHPRIARGTGVTARQPAGCPALEAARATWEESDRRAAGNGAVMRCPPLAIRWRNDDTALVRDTVVSAAATHFDPRCIWSSVLVNLAIASLLRGAAVDTADLAGRAAAAARTLGEALAPFGTGGAGFQLPPEVIDALHAPLPAAPDGIELDGAGMGYTLKAMQVALWSARTESGFREALTAVVNAGGDTDTNGAVAGAVLGARFGCRAIPPRWRGAVARLRPGRPSMESWADRLLRRGASEVRA